MLSSGSEGRPQKPRTLICGFKILPKHWGKTFKIKRPETYYGRSSPEYVEITPMPPPGYGNMSLEEVREYFEDLLREAEDEIRKQRRNKKELGPVRVCRTDPFSCPKTPSQMGTLSPRLARGGLSRGGGDA